MYVFNDLNLNDPWPNLYWTQRHRKRALPPAKSEMSDLFGFGRIVFKSNGLRVDLKELHTSAKTLAQKIVLAPLNNEFKLEIWNTTSFMLKNPPIFLKKIYKNQFLASWRGLMVFIYKYKVVYF